MTYSEKDGTITIEMSRSDYDMLLVILGRGAGVASRDSHKKNLWQFMDFVNRLNNGNPHWIPYEIPYEYKPRADRP